MHKIAYVQNWDMCMSCSEGVIDDKIQHQTMDNTYLNIVLHKKPLNRGVLDILLNHSLYSNRQPAAYYYLNAERDGCMSELVHKDVWELKIQRQYSDRDGIYGVRKGNLTAKHDIRHCCF